VLQVVYLLYSVPFPSKPKTVYAGSRPTFISSITPAATKIVEPPVQLLPTATTSQASMQNYSPSLLILIILSLSSGLVGAVIGVLGTIYATRKQVNALALQEIESREYSERQQKQAIKHALLSEVKENVDLLDSFEGYLSVEAWSIYRGNISIYLPSLIEEFTKFYVGIKRYNSMFSNRNFYNEEVLKIYILFL